MPDNLGAPTDSTGDLLATVLDQSHDCIKLLSLDGIIEYVNRQGAEAMELTSPSELVGQAYLSRWPEQTRPLIEVAIDAARNGRVGRFTASRPTPHASLSWWDVIVSPVRGCGGHVTHFATIARDMTAEVMERERVKTISIEMRHRLKNALTVASGIILLSARGRPDVTEFAQEIVSRLGQLAKVQAMVLDPASDQLLTKYVPMLAGAYGDKGLLQFGELPDAKLGDQAMQALALCFGELATNSLKYGALRDGRPVKIEGTATQGFVELSWYEKTSFNNSRPRGQGLTLIDRLVKTAGGSFQHEIDAQHMRAIMTLPVAD